ncbi:DUF6484 domain-containing protein [Rubellimicrobium arenae]|uniref:DUF6484 domain-containing protein n=1 Tax=Rubellimicrobium arenae TaxID=2817372 RepID=UPI001B3153C0|nr:DUF6484 domain-containing protein [Rubellimicrobium arenae]
MVRLDSEARIEGVVLGMILGFEDGAPSVVFPGNPRDVAIQAKSLQALGTDDIGAEVAIMFMEGDPLRPIVVGRLVRPGPGTSEVTVVGDGEIVRLEARRRIELRCGEASITMFEDGRISIRGTDLLSRSSGSNRIKGGSVQLN